MSEIFYSGERASHVTVREGNTKRLLDLRFDLQPLSAEVVLEKGFAEPELLSLALLADALQDDARALKLYNHFAARVVIMLPTRWTMSRSRIRAYANMIEREAADSPEDADSLRDGPEMMKVLKRP
jgi:hypothetical protein